MEINVEDFRTLQNQLLDEKRLVAELTDKCRKLEKGLDANNATSKLRTLLNRPTANVKRENELLRQQMFLQEEQFKLQISTLKDELEKVASLNLGECSESIPMSIGDERIQIELEKAQMRSKACDRQLYQTKAKSKEALEKIMENSMSKVVQFTEKLTNEMNHSIKKLNKNFDNIDTCIKKCEKTLKENAKFYASKEAEVKNILENMLDRVEMQLKLEFKSKNLSEKMVELSDYELSFKMLETKYDSEVGKLKEEIEGLNKELETICAQKRKLKHEAGVIRDLQRELKLLKGQNDQLREVVKEHCSNQLGHDVDEILMRSRGGRAIECNSLETSSKLYDSLSQSFTLRNQSSSIDLKNQSNSNSFGTLVDTTEISRLSAIREILTEKVKHLEASNASMASDLLTKSELIQMLTVHNQGPLPKGNKAKPGRGCPTCGASSKSTNYHVTRDPIVKSLQTALEDTLIQNLQLKKDMDHLTAQEKSQDSKQPEQ